MVKSRRDAKGRVWSPNKELVKIAEKSFLRSRRKKKPHGGN